PKTLGDGSVWEVAFSPDAAQKYMYITDGKNERIYVLDRKSLDVLTTLAEDARRRFGVGGGVLTGRGAEVHVHHRRQERAHLRARPEIARRADDLRRWRPAAGRVLWGAQHRGGLERQHLHRRDL